MSRLFPTVRAVVAVAARPRLWATAVRQIRMLAAPAWWRRVPFLPVPDRRWLEFRLTTAYGTPSAPVVAEDLVVWLEWAKRQRRSAQTPGPRAHAPR